MEDIRNNDEKKVDVFTKNDISSWLLETLISQVKSLLLLRDFWLYEAAIRKNLKNNHIDQDVLDIKVKEDILEMDEWLFSFDIEDDVWKIVLGKTMEWYILTSVDPDDVSRPNFLTFENMDWEEVVIPL